MDKGKGKKNTTKSGGKSAKKKTTTSKKTEKSAKKKKTIKKNTKDGKQNNDKNESNDLNEGDISTRGQKGKGEENLEELLNQPLTKKKLPPIQKNNENDNGEEEIKEEEKVEEKGEEKPEEKIEKKDEIQKIEMCVGTPYFYNIKGLKNNIETKSKKINEENDAQEKYKISLNNLLNDLNKVLSENVELLYNDAEDENRKKKQANITYLQNILLSYQQKIKESKEKNKLYKQHYELLSKKDENTKMQNVKEYEALIEEKKNDNNELNKKIIELKQKSRVGGKKLEAYSGNKVYPQDINNLTNQLKTLSKKKGDYFAKLNKDKKTLIICQKELENLEKVYSEQKKANNYCNAKIEEDINRLKDDLKGNEEEIYNKVENDKTFIQRKEAHQEKVNNVMKIQSINKPNEVGTAKFKKGNSLEPIRKAIRYDVKSGYNTRRINIVAQNKNQIQINYNKSNTKENINNNNKEKDILEEDDFSNINYNNLTDYEYRELCTKKEHYFDVTTKLENSIKEAQKMYIRKIKDIKTLLDENSKKLSNRKQENELLQSEITDLNKILLLTEEENKINNTNLNNNKNIQNATKTKTNNNDEKELESHKEYLSPDYYTINKNKKEKDKVLIPTHSNNDITGNEILNDLKGINLEGNQQGVSLIDQGGNKLSNLGMKFPDFSNIEDDKGDKIVNNEIERSKAIDDIKKKYNIKKINKDENNDIDIDYNDLNFDEGNDEKIRKEQENIKKKEIEDRERLAKEIEDEKKFFKEHENILKTEEEGQFEPPIENNIEIENNNEIENNDDNKENKDNENEEKKSNNVKENNEDNKLTISEKKDQDQVNYKKTVNEEEINNENNNKEKGEEEIQTINDEKIEENNKEKDNIIEQVKINEQHQDDIKIEGIKNEIKENIEENKIEDNKKIEEGTNKEKEEIKENDNQINIEEEEKKKEKELEDNKKETNIILDNNKNEENNKNDENKVEEIKNEENKVEEIKNEENKVEEIKNDENRVEEIKNDENKREEIKNEENKVEEIKNEENKVEEIKNDENRVEEIKNEDNKVEEIKNEDNKIEENKTEENKKEENKIEENKNEENKNEENNEKEKEKEKEIENINETKEEKNDEKKEEINNQNNNNEENKDDNKEKDKNEENNIEKKEEEKENNNKKDEENKNENNNNEKQKEENKKENKKEDKNEDEIDVLELEDL